MPPELQIKFDLVVPFEVGEELLDGGHENTNAAKVPHVGKYMNRIYSLQGSVHLKHFAKFVTYGIKDCIVESMFGHDGPG